MELVRGDGGALRMEEEDNTAREEKGSDKNMGNMEYMGLSGYNGIDRSM